MQGAIAERRKEKPEKIRHRDSRGHRENYDVPVVLDIPVRVGRVRNLVYEYTAAGKYARVRCIGV